MRQFFWLPLGLSALLVLLALSGLVAMSWRNLERLQPVQEHLAHIARIQNVGLAMEQTLLEGLRGVQVGGEQLDELRGELREVAALEGALQPDTNRRLAGVAERIAATGPGALETLFETLAELRSVLADERAQHDLLMLNVTESTRMELRLAVLLLVVLPLSGGVATLWLLRRTTQPLKDLQHLLNRLSGRDFRLVSDEVLLNTTKLARPAFQSYNAMVSRLQELEAEHQDRERLLEQRVRAATEALLAQSRELSRAERLAAVGAVSAGLAHELRNPLAGIQLACSKLRNKIADGDQSNRISAVISELQRINHLLTEQVDAARHAPEPMVDVDIAAAVRELLDLLRYQVPSQFALQVSVDEGLHCVLPAAGFRQALLNLLLNAVQIQGEEGRVEVSATRSNGHLVMSVSDDGPGFPKEALIAGIRPFATGRIGGTGLGLAMVRRFVRDLDGQLELDNRSPRGAQVTMSLPCGAAVESGDHDNA